MYARYMNNTCTLHVALHILKLHVALHVHVRYMYNTSTLLYSLMIKSIIIKTIDKDKQYSNNVRHDNQIRLRTKEEEGH